MDWNPADEFSGDDPSVCECCDGSGVIVHACRTYEHGCGFAHDNSYETRCEECHGTGRNEPRISVSPNQSHQAVIPDDDLPF